MSKSENKPIENAAEVIEMFGGIRPMSAKINVAVTTIQGWKKRNNIPAARKNALLEAAVTHNIDLSNIFDDAPPAVAVIGEDSSPDTTMDDVADENTEEVIVAEEDSPVDDAVVIEDDKEADSDIVEIMTVPPVVQKPDEFRSPPKAAQPCQDFTEIAIETERKAITKSAAIAASMVLLVLAAIVAMLWPDFEEFGVRGDRLATLEDSLSDIKDKQSTFKGLVPENWSQQLADLKNQVEQAKVAVSNTVEGVQTASQKFVKENGLEEQVVQLQSYVSEIASESGVYGLLTRFEGLEDSNPGQKALDDSVLELSTILPALKGKDETYINSVLNTARSQSSALQHTLGNVPQKELKAAAMLLALTQVRSALNRKDEAFDSDLGLLMNMVDADNIELRSSLTKLAPHAKSGVLSASGLQSEFREVAGEAVVASLNGEDVSFSEKASARMNEILQIEKDGELLSGTETQATVNKAEKMLVGGNLQDALDLLQSKLRAKELEPLRPWIKKVEAVLNSRKVQKAIQEAIDLSIGSDLLGGKQLLNGEK